MRIRKAKQQSVTIKWELDIYFNGVEIPIIMETVDGKVMGDHNSNVSTCYLNYIYETTEEERKVHFQKMKKYIENEMIDLKIIQ